MNDAKQFEEILEKVERLRAESHIDLSTEEDLSVAIMNLISLEEHFFFTGVKTEKDEYFDLLGEVREVRKKLLRRLIDSHEGETWCIAKHLLATTMRLIEVGTKLHADGRKSEAKETFEQAHRMYTLFWGLRLKLLNVAGLKATAASEHPWTLKEIVAKLVDCCDE